MDEVKSTPFETEKEPRPKFVSIPEGCPHSYRIIFDFFDGSRGRDERTYIFYCIYCLKSRAETFSRLKKSN